MALRLGDMRHQVRIEQKVTTQDNAGEPVNTWQLFALRRVAVEQTPGKEVWASAQRNERVPTIFHLRYMVGISSDMRIVWNGTEFNILSIVDPGGMHAELVISAMQTTK